MKERQCEKDRKREEKKHDRHSKIEKEQAITWTTDRAAKVKVVKGGAKARKRKSPAITWTTDHAAKVVKGTMAPECSLSASERSGLKIAPTRVKALPGHSKRRRKTIEMERKVEEGKRGGKESRTIPLALSASSFLALVPSSFPGNAHPIQAGLSSAYSWIMMLFCSETALLLSPLGLALLSPPLRSSDLSNSFRFSSYLLR